MWCCTVYGPVYPAPRPPGGILLFAETDFIVEVTETVSLLLQALTVPF